MKTLENQVEYLTELIKYIEARPLDADGVHLCQTDLEFCLEALRMYLPIVVDKGEQAILQVSPAFTTLAQAASEHLS